MNHFFTSGMLWLLMDKTVFSPCLLSDSSDPFPRLHFLYDNGIIFFVTFLKKLRLTGMRGSKAGNGMELV